MNGKLLIVNGEWGSGANEHFIHYSLFFAPCSLFFERGVA